MHNLAQLRNLIETRLNDLPLEKTPIELYEPIRYTLKLGGKRLRPALCLMACELFDGKLEDALDPAIGIEIFHNFTLLHDDIMDQAPLRRGKETVHLKWNANVAILSGDTMMAMAYGCIMNAPEKYRKEVFDLFNRTAIEVCEGQQVDMNFESRGHVSIDDYLEMIRLKTAVLLAASLRIGAIIGGASHDEAEKLYHFGEHIGIAFQLKDDLLDVFSETGKFGKTTGGDIIANKKTFLFLKALELADRSDRERLLALYGTRPPDPAYKIREVIGLFNRYNLREVTATKIDQYYRVGMQSLDSLQISAERKAGLLQFAGDLKKRET